MENFIILLFPVLAFGMGQPSLVESENFVIIRKPSDLTNDKLTLLRAKLFQPNQGGDNPHPSLVPVTVAFEPASTPYNIGNVDMGYYTMLMGLGTSPDDVVIEGTISVNKGLNSVDNVFFKGLSNLKFNGDLQWGTSQMCPLRHVHITGSIDLGNGVGGLLADSIVDGQIIDRGQQEWLFRNVTGKGGVTGRAEHNGQMNFVFVDSQVPTQPNSDLCEGEGKTCGSYYPSKQNPAPSFAVNTATLPRQFSENVKPLITKHMITDLCSHVQSQSDLDRLVLASGDCVLIHPGVYDVTKSLVLAGEKTMVLGLGFPVLRSTLGDATIKVIGTRCVLASLIVDAPLLSYDQDIMIDVTGAEAEVYDVTGRTELAWFSPVQKVKTNTMFHVGGANAYIEYIWLWRGDHWSGPDLEGSSFANKKWDPYNLNPYGLHVSKEATSVTCMGALVEHQLWNPIYWEGDDGIFIMSQGECAYTENGRTEPEIAGSTVKRLPGPSPGIYYTVGAAVKKHIYIGGGIYNVFGEQFSKGIFPATEVLAEITSEIQIRNLMIAGWVNVGHFNSILRYRGQKYGPALTGGQASFYLCDLLKLLGGPPPPTPPTPPPPGCGDITCTLRNTDYWGTLPGWPKGTEMHKGDPHMDEQQCCNLCTQHPGCSYWKADGNGNCYYYETPSKVSHDMWRKFTSSHPSNMWNVGLHDDVCCKCGGSPSGDNNACGPTSPSKITSQPSVIFL